MIGAEFPAMLEDGTVYGGAWRWSTYPDPGLDMVIPRRIWIGI